MLYLEEHSVSETIVSDDSKRLNCRECGKEDAMGYMNVQRTRHGPSASWPE